MMFTKRLREGIREGRITCSVRIWTRPHVRVGGLYPMEGGHIVVESIQPISFDDNTGVVDWNWDKQNSLRGNLEMQLSERLQLTLNTA
mgnify:CR=1 FL=1